MRPLLVISILVLLLGACGAAEPSHPDDGGAAAARGTMIVYKSPTCGCCQEWIAYVRRHGFAVTVQETDDLAPLKARHGVPVSAQSCHLALIDGYALEGHVPVAEITRLLAERPPLLGLAVPGMPLGSPGMEVPGGAQDAFDVLGFDAQGATSVFARYSR